MEFGIEKCAMLVIKSGKRHMPEGKELPDHVIIRTLGEKETYKYLGVLEADTLKQVEMKEKILKRSISKEPENYSGQNSIAGTLSKGWMPGLSPRKILGTILEVDQRRT